MWKKDGACQIEIYVKNMDVNNIIHAQHWIENCGGMSACLQHNPVSTHSIFLEHEHFGLDICLFPQKNDFILSRSEQNAGSSHWIMEEWLEDTVFPTPAPHCSPHF